MDWNAADRWATFRRIKKRNVCIYPILVDDGHSLHTRSFFLSPPFYSYTRQSQSVKALRFSMHHPSQYDLDDE
jgi:hypothetical protein